MAKNGLNLLNLINIHEEILLLACNAHDQITRNEKGTLHRDSVSSNKVQFAYCQYSNPEF